MNVWVRTTIFGAAAAVIAVSAAAAPKAESRLAGIKLYDTGVDVVRKLGSPNDIFPVSWDSSGNSGGAGGGGGGGFAPSPAGGGGGKLGNRGGAGMQGSIGDFAVPPLSFAQRSANGPMTAPGGPGPAPAGGGGPSPAGGGSGGGSGMSGTTDTQYVRWVYRRSAGSSLNVVLNKFNKVVQIEVIGVSNGAARTSRGITLGSNLASVMKAYKNPDGYEVSGDYFMIKFLRSSKVAFRFTRENANAPYRVTGIVVSAGKS